MRHKRIASMPLISGTNASKSSRSTLTLPLCMTTWKPKTLPHWFHCDHTLAYIEWFRPIGEPNEPLCMPPVSYATREGRHHAAIVPIHSILRSCHLTPKFGRQRNATWTAENVLDKCSDFFLNSHLSIYMFQMCDSNFVLEDNT
ncbi:hypothetical protein JB92DRAFT_2918097 [Gautieria morchelliformis]|nr:hypothetical protein JB92DRAFT_2918097 [Gautieria morchelliformis]